MPNQRCEMLISWRSSKTNPVDFEDYDIDVTCRNPATYTYEGVYCCTECAEAMKKEGFTLLPYPIPTRFERESVI